jgi:hypothetical protein
VPVRLRLERKVVKVAQQAQDGDAKKLHAMLDFSKTLLDTREEVNEWLKSTLCFSDHNEDGHYHEDTTPNETEYEAYFHVASVLYRIDRPIIET